MDNTVEKGTWVKIHRIVLKEGERAPQIPKDTQSVPLELWVKGTLIETSEIDKNVNVLTKTGRVEEGVIVEVNPTYDHTFGHYTPEIATIGLELRTILFGGETDD
jgi:hypothetical protein